MLESEEKAVRMGRPQETIPLTRGINVSAYNIHILNFFDIVKSREPFSHIKQNKNGRMTEIDQQIRVEVSRRGHVIREGAQHAGSRDPACWDLNIR